MDKTQHLASPALLCQQCQRSYFDILKVLAAENIKPVLTLDLVPYFDWNEASRALERQNMPMIQRASNA